VAAQIRELRPPEPYKGKGIKYSDETIRRKAGKAAARSFSELIDMAFNRAISRATRKTGCGRKCARLRCDARLSIYRSLHHIYAQVHFG